MKANKVLLLGMGSEVLMDVGIPYRLVKDFEEDALFGGMDFESVYLGGLDLLEYIDGYKAVVFIDTIKTEEGDPGKVHLISTENYRETLHLSSRHDLSFLDTLKLGKRLGFSLPVHIRIIAVEITEDLEIGMELSRELNSLYPEIHSKVVNCITEIFNEIGTEI
jgi:hydrogenase maturation protease